MSIPPFLILAVSWLIAYSSYFAQAKFCQPLNATLFERCRSNAGYNYTFITNNSDFEEVQELLAFIVKHEISDLAHCSTAVDLLVCSMSVPSCVEGKSGPMLPCQRVCHDVVRGCEASKEPFFYEELERIKGMCQFLPNHTRESGKCLEPAGFQPRYPAEEVVQKCFPMVDNECSSLGYNSTTQGKGDMKRIKVFLDSHLKTMMGTDAVCAPLMKKIVCANFLPPCYPEDNGRPTLYTACKSDCDILKEKCPELLREYLGNLGYCRELGSASKTAHGFCQLTQWPPAGRWPSYVIPTPTLTSTTPVIHNRTRCPSYVTPTPTLTSTTPVIHNRTSPAPSPPAMRSHRAGRHVSLAAILVPAILVSVVLIIAGSVICCKRRKRPVIFERRYRRQRNESETTGI